MTDDPDRDLVTRMARGDQAALRALYARHGTRVFRFILQMVKNEAIAEELTNEVFLDVWRHAASFRGEARPSTWLISVARNRAISLLRKKRDEALDDETAHAVADDTDSAETVLAKQGKAGLMRAAIDKLSPLHREIVDLVYYHERSLAEAADILAIPENTVKTRLFHARKQLSEIFRRAGIDRGWP